MKTVDKLLALVVLVSEYRGSSSINDREGPKHIYKSTKFIKNNLDINV